MSNLIHVPASGEEPSMTDEPAAVHIDREFGQRRRKMAVEIPAPWDDDGEAKAAMMDLDYERSARQWDDVAEAWSVNLSDLNHVVRHFAAVGYDVTVDLRVAREFEEYSRGGEFLPERRC